MKLIYVQLSSLALSMFALTAPQCGAQEARPALGIVVGASISKMEGAAVSPGAASRKGLVAGLSLVSASRARFQLEVDGLYTDRGYRVPTSANKLAFNISYVDVPLLARVSILGNENGSVFLVAGPSLNVRVRCSFDVNDAAGNSSQSCDSPEADSKLSRTDIALVFGAGAHMIRNRTDIGVGARYQIGTSDVATNVDAKNRGFIVFLALARSRK